MFSSSLQADDYHALGVAKAIERDGGYPVIVDNSDFPQSIGLRHRQKGEEIESRLTLKEGRTIQLDTLTGVWWRRPQDYKPAETTLHPALRRFVMDEAREAFLGALAASVPNFINPVGASRQASHKLAQLPRAVHYGLHIPETLVTNEPDAARDFAASRLGACIYKTFTGCDFSPCETRLLASAEDYNELERVKDCPIILQEHIAGEYDVRVTVVGNEAFAASIHYKAGKHPVDGRVSQAPIYRHELPSEVQESVISLVQSYGLFYGAVDLRFSKEQGYIFFEINPEGQFLWVEIEAELGICDAMARLLMNKSEYPLVGTVETPDFLSP
jgi:glutathione synthase/RimK-type ligase-like ATP-grasp enzyme